MHRRRPWSSALQALQGKTATGRPGSRRAGPVPEPCPRFARADRWSLVFGEIALYCFVVLAATGVYLAMFFDPAMNRVAYHGSYVPLRWLWRGPVPADRRPSRPPATARLRVTASRCFAYVSLC